jgi:NADP-dependent 3-hydroxy acid dehydrogenase YdfG
MDAMTDLKTTYGEALRVAHLEVTDKPAIHQIVNQAFAELGKIDVVVNNAGRGLFGAAEELTDEQIIHQINSNSVSGLPSSKRRRISLSRTDLPMNA